MKVNKLVTAAALIFMAATFTIAGTTWPSETHETEQGAKPESLAKGRLIIAEDAVGKKVADYTLVNQDGVKFQLKEFEGKPYLVNFIYTKCNHACPIITASLATAVKKVKKQLGVRYRVLTVGFDHVNDSPEAMKKFGSSFVDKFDGWTFATADEETIKALTFNFGFYYQKEQSGGFAHMNMISVVDSKGVIRGHVYGMEPSKKEVLKKLKEVW